MGLSGQFHTSTMCPLSGGLCGPKASLSDVCCTLPSGIADICECVGPTISIVFYSFKLKKRNEVAPQYAICPDMRHVTCGPRIESPGVVMYDFLTVIL